MALPFVPQALVDLQQRYAAALSPTYDPVAIALDGATRPGQLRQHVFDFDGEQRLRLIVSREIGKYYHLACDVIHISGSYCPRDGEQPPIDPLTATIEQTLPIAQAMDIDFPVLMFRQLAGLPPAGPTNDETWMTFIGISLGAGWPICHFLLPMTWTVADETDETGTPMKVN